MEPLDRRDGRHHHLLPDLADLLHRIRLLPARRLRHVAQQLLTRLDCHVRVPWRHYDLPLQGRRRPRRLESLWHLVRVIPSVSDLGSRHRPVRAPRRRRWCRIRHLLPRSRRERGAGEEATADRRRASWDLGQEHLPGKDLLPHVLPGKSGRRHQHQHQHPSIESFH